MKMFKFKYHYCKTRMTAFINDELPPRARRRIARYMDECPDCYAEYLRQRDLQHELMRNLPSFGRPRPAQLGHIWSAIQQNMRTRASQVRHRYHARYGLSTLMLLLTLFLPLLVRHDSVSRVTVTQPMP